MAAMSNNPQHPAATPRPCPLCNKPSAADYHPFCSRGCRDRDLINWFGEDYRLPVSPGEMEGDDAPSILPSDPANRD